MAGKRRSVQRSWLAAGVLAALGIGLGAWYALGVPPYPAWLAGASIVLFAVYGVDKRRAVGGGRRAPEAALHLLALAGGFAGGWAGRYLFRHKTRKVGLVIVLLLATVLHLAIIIRMYL